MPPARRWALLAPLVLLAAPEVRAAEYVPPVTSVRHHRISLDAWWRSVWDLGKPSLAIDSRSRKVVFVAKDWTSKGIVLFRCELDGITCQHTELAPAIPALWEPSLAIDPMRGKLIVAAQADKPGRLVLLRCELDGRSCTRRIIRSRDHVGPLAIDPRGGTLFVAASDSRYRPTLYRCDEATLVCAHLALSARARPYSGFTPSVAIDTLERPCPRRDARRIE
jgi:hypothetical protein